MHLTLQIALDDVIGRHRSGRHAARNEKAIWVFGIADTDVTKAIKDAFVGQNLIGRRQVFDQLLNCSGVGHGDFFQSE